MKSILDKSFKYVPAAKSDISKTFARIRRELAEKAKTADAPKIIIPIRIAKK